MKGPEAPEVVARFSFKKDRAHEFNDDGRQVVEMDSLTIEEVVRFSKEFCDSLDDICILIDGSKVVYMTDYLYESSQEGLEGI